MVDKAKKTSAWLALKSGLVITDVKEAHYNQEVAVAIKIMVLYNTPYVKASAVIGAEGAAPVTMQVAIFLTQLELKSFPRSEEDLEYLVSVE